MIYKINNINFNIPNFTSSSVKSLEESVIKQIYDYLEFNISQDEFEKKFCENIDTCMTNKNLQTPLVMNAITIFSDGQQSEENTNYKKVQTRYAFAQLLQSQKNAGKFLNIIRSDYSKYLY